MRHRMAMHFPKESRDTLSHCESVWFLGHYLSRAVSGVTLVDHADLRGRIAWLKSLGAWIAQPGEPSTWNQNIRNRTGSRPHPPARRLLRPEADLGIQL